MVSESQLTKTIQFVVGWLILYHEVKETNTGVTCNYKVNDHEHSFNHRPNP